MSHNQNPEQEARDRIDGKLGHDGRGYQSRDLRRTPEDENLKFTDLKDFIRFYNPENRFQRKETGSEENPEGRFRKFTYEEIAARDKTNLNIFWLKDKSLADLDNLPDPDILANEIIGNIEASLENFREVLGIVNGNNSPE